MLQDALIRVLKDLEILSYDATSKDLKIISRDGFQLFRLGLVPLEDYDVFKHGPSTNVITLNGRKGVVVRIEETAPEWIEPIVLWDDTKDESRANTKLFLY